MQNTITSEDIKKIKQKMYDDLTDAVTDALYREVISLEDGKKSAAFILDHLERVVSKDELILFLYDLATKWALYNPYYVKMKYETKKGEEEQKIETIRSKLNTFISPS